MKGIFKILSIVVLLGALVGGAILVQRNQETRKGAAANGTSVSVLPGSVVVASGKNFEVHTWVNTGKNTDKLSGVEFKVSYDSTKLKYVSSEAQNGYTVLNEVVDDGRGTLTLKMVTLGAEKAGAVDVLKVTFRPVGNVSGAISPKGGVVMISGQSATWNVAKYNASNYAPVSRPTSRKPIPTRVKVTPTRVKVTPTLSSPLRCGWCGTSCINSKIKRMCPMIAPPKGSSCVAENGACVIKISRVTPTGVGVMSATLNGGFNGSKVKVGDEVSAFMKIGVGNYKVSAVNVRAIFDPNYFDILSVTPITGAEVLRNNVNKVTGVVDLYLTWKGSASTLPSSPEFVIVKLKTKKSGVGTFKFDGNYKNEVSGVDSAGKSVGFTVLISGTVPRLIITDLTVAPKCLVCTSGLAKSMGNGNCDAVINSLDFEIWRSEVFDQGGVTGKLSSTWNADYSCDQKVSAPDFEIWRATVFK